MVSLFGVLLFVGYGANQMNQISSVFSAHVFGVGQLTVHRMLLTLFFTNEQKIRVVLKHV